MNQDIIKNNKWCNSAVNINEYKCEDTIESKVGLLTTQEYLKSGGVNSYLNNRGIEKSLYNYGVRPVLTIDKEVLYRGGDGSETDPYTTYNNKEVKIGGHPVGTYVSYNNYTWKIIETNEEYTKIILDGIIKDENDEPVKLTYSKVDNYLKNTFLKTFNTDELVTAPYPKTELNLSSSYNYANTISTDKGYIGLPVVGDLFITDYPATWLNSYYNQKQGLVYATASEGSLLADLSSDENNIRPVISIKSDLIIAGGEGTKESPHVVGDNK